MEYAGGGTVRDELDRSIRKRSSLYGMTAASHGNSDAQPSRVGELPGWRKFEILNQLAVAMYVVHSQGIIHADVKPTNCMVMQVRTHSN
jgi:serine/threonine protein kinase